MDNYRAVADFSPAVADFFPAVADFFPVIPAFSPRHSRESGNPDGRAQARHSKSGMNSSQRIPYPFMGIKG